MPNIQEYIFIKFGELKTLQAKAASAEILQEKLEEMVKENQDLKDQLERELFEKEALKKFISSLIAEITKS